MGSQCFYYNKCSCRHITEMQSKELIVDIPTNNDPSIINNQINTTNLSSSNNHNQSSMTQIKSMFSSNPKSPKPKHKSVVVTYGIILQKLLMEKHYKSHIKRKKTIKSPSYLRDIVQDLLKQHKPNDIDASTNTTTQSIIMFNQSSSNGNCAGNRLSNAQIQFILKALYDKGNLPESSINDYHMNSIFASIEHKVFPPMTDLYNKGNQMQLCFIIETGCVEYQLDDEFNYLIAGEVFTTDVLEKNSEIDCNARTLEASQLFYFEITEEIRKVMLSVNFHLKIKDEKIKTLLHTPLFRALEGSKLDKISKGMKKVYYRAHEEIAQEDHKTESLYFLIRGSVLSYKEHKVVKRLNPLTLFLEGPLFYDEDCYFTYCSDIESILYKIDYQEIREILGKGYARELIMKMFIYQIKKNETMSKFLNMKLFNQFFDLFQLKKYKNEIISTNKAEGEEVKVDAKEKPKRRNVFVVISGRIKLNSSMEIIGNPGDFIGEYLLNKSRSIRIDIRAEDECIVFEAHWTKIIKTMQCTSLGDNDLFYPLMKTIRKLSQFKHISEWKLFQLIDALTIFTYKDKELIMKTGDERLCIIKSGKVNTIIKDFNMKIYEQGEAFGDLNASPPVNTKQAPLPTTYIAAGDVCCYMLQKEQFDEITEISHAISKYDKPFDSRDATFPLDEVYFIKEIGAGGYGKVSLVHNTKNVYAAKTVLIKSKNTKTLRYYVNEKNIMCELNHNLIVKLVNTFKTNFHLFFIIEYIEGVTLSKFIQKRPKFAALRNVQQVQFLGACLFSVVNYLQRMRIIHRDIKPSNCILNTNGYLKVIDFGIAKDLTGKDKTKTVIGTTQYFSPEMLLGKGYSFPIDYWAIGVLLFKFYYGSIPFGEGEADVMKIYNEITQRPLSLPSDNKSIDFNALMTGLLCKNPSKRISSMRQLKQTALYAQFDFDELGKTKMVSPLLNDLTSTLKNMKGKGKKGRVDYKDVAISLRSYVENEMIGDGDSDYYCSEKSNEYVDDF